MNPIIPILLFLAVLTLALASAYGFPAPASPDHHSNRLGNGLVTAALLLLTLALAFYVSAR